MYGRPTALQSWRVDAMTAPTWPLETEEIAHLERLVQRHDVTVNGRSVVWRRCGRGEPLVLLHGGHGSWLHWARNLEFLAQDHEVWVPDLPGYGDSDPLGSSSLDDLVGATSRSLDVLVGAQTAVSLVGFSFGGLVAATLASRRPSVSRLALLGAAGHGGIRRPRGPLRSWKDLAVGSTEWLDVMRNNLQMHMLHDSSRVDELAMQVHSQSCLATRFHSKRISRAGGLQQVLDSYPGPVLLAWGEHDVTADPATTGSQLAAQRPQREVVLIDGAGHWVQYEQADRVNALVRQWMQSGGESS